jgi:hypothetical protein
MPETPEATVTFTCAACDDWTRTCGRFDTQRGVDISFEFDDHEAEAHPTGAHMKIETTYS